MNLKLFLTECGTHISHVKNILFISSECPFHTLGVDAPTFQVYIIINYFFYRTTKVIGQQKPGFCKFKKVISKTDHKKKILSTSAPHNCSVLSLYFVQKGFGPIF